MVLVLRGGEAIYLSAASTVAAVCSLEMLVLKTLALESMHGYGIAFRIEQVSACVFRVNPGSLLPALRRMERAGRIRGNGARRKTTAGRNSIR